MSRPVPPPTTALTFLNTRCQSVSTGKIGVVVRIENSQATRLAAVKAFLKLDDGSICSFSLADLKSVT